MDLLVRAGADVHLATTKVFAYILCGLQSYYIQVCIIIIYTYTYMYMYVCQSTSNYMSVSNSMFSDRIHGLIVYAMVPLLFVIRYVQALNVILYVQVFRHILVSPSDVAIA